MKLLLIGFLFLALPGSAVDNQIVNIEHRPVSCAVSEKFPRLEATLAPAGSVATARAVFQGQSPEWYSVSMKPEGAVFAGVLPKPKKSLKSFRYYLEVTDKALGTSRTAEYTTNVVASPGECSGKVMAATLGSASVLLQGPAGLAAWPAGFASSGVAVAGSAAGSSASAAGAATAAGGGIGTTALVLGGVAVAGGAVAVAASKGEPVAAPPPSVTGTWVGTVSVSWTGSIPAANCSVESATLTLTLDQSGSSVSGTRRGLTVTPGTCADGSRTSEVGSGASRPISGSVNPPDITFSGVCGGSGTATWTGKISGNTMDGTYLCNPLLPEDPSARNAGAWHVTKQ